MGRLFNPGPGEILDRLSILELKIQYGRESGRPVDHFVEEGKALERLPISSFAAWQTLRGLHDRMQRINTELWEAEDLLRSYRRKREAEDGLHLDDTIALGHLAMTIQELNDRRAATIAEINRVTGFSEAKEKL